MVGEIDNPESLTELILNSCEHSTFFSHRIWFFCQSLLFASTEEGSKHRDKTRDLIKHLEQVVIKSQELLCLVNSYDLMQQIIKLGLLPLYPSFNRHQTSEALATEALNKFKEFIKNISKQRVKMAKTLIDEYHKKSEEAVKKETNEFTIAANKGEKLVDIDTKFNE